MIDLDSDPPLRPCHFDDDILALSFAYLMSIFSRHSVVWVPGVLSGHIPIDETLCPSPFGFYFPFFSPGFCFVPCCLINHVLDVDVVCWGVEADLAFFVLILIAHCQISLDADLFYMSALWPSVIACFVPKISTCSSTENRFCSMLDRILNITAL